MHLERIRLFNFNNYAEAEIQFHEDMNALTGSNGMGKTNMLDAVYYLCIGKSYFSSGDRYVVKKEEASFSCAGDFLLENGREKVEIKVTPGKKKEIALSGKKRERLSDHIGRFPCVIIAPIDIQLMLEGSEERRKFLDNTIMQYNRSYVDSILTYNRLLKQRNATLKAFAEKGYEHKELLDSISAGMFKPAEKVYQGRKELIQIISPLFEKYYRLLSDDSEFCQLEFKSQLHNESLGNLLEQNYEKDKILCRTLAGIHKDDLTLKMNGTQLKNYASQGQLKSVILALKLAQYELLNEKNENRPILILDDVFDKLDRSRVEHLIQIVSEKNIGQVFISDTHNDRVPELLKKLNVQHAHYNVVDGRLNRV